MRLLRSSTQLTFELGLHFTLFYRSHGGKAPREHYDPVSPSSKVEGQLIWVSSSYQSYDCDFSKYRYPHLEHIPFQHNRVLFRPCALDIFSFSSWCRASL